MKCSIKYKHNKKQKHEEYRFIEDGKTVKVCAFSTFNVGNLGGKILGECIGEAVKYTKERGWTFETLDKETQIEYGELYL